VGLIARSIEAVGVPTVTVSLAKALTEAVGVPRAIFVRWPLGHPLGERQQPAQQRTMIFAALRLLLEAKQPGLIAEPGYRWKRETYTEPDWRQLKT
jgi:D-proline reductase (dithiol) PrdB